MRCLFESSGDLIDLFAVIVMSFQWCIKETESTSKIFNDLNYKFVNILCQQYKRNHRADNWRMIVHVEIFSCVHHLHGSSELRYGLQFLQGVYPAFTAADRFPTCGHHTVTGKPITALLNSPCYAAVYAPMRCHQNHLTTKLPIFVFFAGMGTVQNTPFCFLLVTILT